MESGQSGRHAVKQGGMHHLRRPEVRFRRDAGRAYRQYNRRGMMTGEGGYGMAMNELATASVQLVWEKDPATFWTLVPSADNVSRRADGSVSPSVVSVDVVKTTGSEQERVKHGILRFSRNDYALEELPVSASGTSNGVNIGSSSSVTFRLYDTDGRTLLANRRIPVVDDGQPGQPGADSVTWTLVPSATAVRYDTMTGAYSP